MYNFHRYIIIIAIFLLAGCENAEIKTILQTGFDRDNPRGDRAICFVVGTITYPYTSIEVTGELDERGYNRFIDDNNILNRRLPLFAQLGLLSETPALDKQGQPSGFFHYDLTDLGRQYSGYYLREWQVFCFGKVIVDSIADKSHIINNLGYDILTVKYNYHIEGEIPTWAKSMILNKIVMFEDAKRKEINWSDRSATQRFINTKEGLVPQYPVISSDIENLWLVFVGNTNKYFVVNSEGKLIQRPLEEITDSYAPMHQKR